MRIESVTAHAFGPLKGETLEFAPGMTVIVGDNESAKSSWHAAIYSSLCGRRRGKGRASKEEQNFADLHQPWDGGQWLVSAVVCLDDGRRIELRQDLDGKVDCHAIDLALGREVSAEVMYEGTPDAARWLGLDRRSFVATACVNQAQLLGVLEGADGLQSYLERAASTAGADATATEALERLEAFRRDHVGRDDARSAKPLRKAITRLDDARRELGEARESHASYLQCLEEVEKLRRSAEEAERRAALQEAAAARRLAVDQRTRYERVVDLERGLGGVAPQSATDTFALSAKVERALEAWRDRSDFITLDGPSVAELEEEISQLPAMPDGEVGVSSETQQAYGMLTRIESALEAHDATRPNSPEMPPLDIDAAELVELAQALEQSPPAADPSLANRVQVLTGRARALEVANRRSTLLLGVGILLTVVGSFGATIGPRATSVVALIGIVIIVVGALTRKRRRLAIAKAELFELQAQAVRAREGTLQITETRQRAEARCSELGIPPVPASLRVLVGRQARFQAYEEGISDWGQKRAELVAGREKAAERLRTALEQTGDPVDCDVMTAFIEHEDRCRERAIIAEKARRRSGLEAQLHERKRSEEMAAKAAAARQAAEGNILEAARSCGLQSRSPEEAAVALGIWKQRCQADLDELEARRKEWSEFEALLDGRTVEQLAEALTAAERDAQARAARFDLAEIAAMADEDIASELPTLWKAATDAKTDAAAAGGALGAQARGLPCVADAEEGLASAESELARVRELDETLVEASEFLAKAQQGVQRDVAPLLAATLTRWLPRTTAGRYIDAMVDPTTLEVRVCGPSRRWRRADRLSRGTAEQVYLLLRVALSRHLTGGKGVCPLLLDDVTVQADAGRTVEILGLLHDLSAEQQVVVFTQERLVAEWAERNLHESVDAIRELPVVGTE